MNDPGVYQQLVKSVAGSLPPGASELESRALQGRLTFAASMWAVRHTDCPCEACKYLRRGIELMEREAEKGLRDAPSDHPQA